jgi:hypothetical protein
MAALKRLCRSHSKQLRKPLGRDHNRSDQPLDRQRLGQHLGEVRCEAVQAGVPAHEFRCHRNSIDLLRDVRLDHDGGRRRRRLGLVVAGLHGAGDADALRQFDLVGVLEKAEEFGFHLLLDLLRGEPHHALVVGIDNLLRQFGRLDLAQLLDRVDDLAGRLVENLLEQRHLDRRTERLGLAAGLDVGEKLRGFLLEFLPQVRHRLALEIGHVAAAPQRDAAPLVGLGAVADIHLLLQLDLMLAGRGLAAVPFLHQDFVVEAAFGFERARAALRIVNIGIARTTEQPAAHIDLRAVGLPVGRHLEPQVRCGLLEKKRLHLAAPVEPVVIRSRRLDPVSKTLEQHPFGHVGRDTREGRHFRRRNR